MFIPTKEDLLKETSNPRVSPAVAKKVLDLVNSDETSSKVLCRTLELDQAIAANVLRVSNSAFYGLRQEVTSISQAVLVLASAAGSYITGETLHVNGGMLMD